MEVKNNIVLSPDGVINNPNVHDAKLVGIFFPADKVVLLVIKGILSVIHCIALNGVERFRAEDLREGNIILDITVVSGDAVNSSDVSYVLGLINDSTHERFLINTMERFRSKELLLVKINPSYGATCICMCTNIELSLEWAQRFKVMQS